MNKKPPYLLLGLLLFCSTLNAQIYIGVDYMIGAINVVSGGVDTETSNPTQTAKIKLGVGEDGGLKYQFTTAYINYDDAIFDNKNTTQYEVSFDLIKEFEKMYDVSALLKLGIGSGVMSIDNVSRAEIYSLLYTAGIGLSYQASEHFYVVGGLDFVGRSWQNVEYETAVSNTLSTSSTSLSPYAGINYKF